jgi:hypothetical protein
MEVLCVLCEEETVLEKFSQIQYKISSDKICASKIEYVGHLFMKVTRTGHVGHL